MIGKMIRRLRGVFNLFPQLQTTWVQVPGKNAWIGVTLYPKDVDGMIGEVAVLKTNKVGVIETESVERVYLTKSLTLRRFGEDDTE